MEKTQRSAELRGEGGYKSNPVNTLEGRKRAGKTCSILTGLGLSNYSFLTQGKPLKKLT